MVNELHQHHIRYNYPYPITSITHWRVDFELVFWIKRYKDKDEDLKLMQIKHVCWLCTDTGGPCVTLVGGTGVTLVGMHDLCYKCKTTCFYFVLGSLKLI